jgi:chemotaxis protein methyltransferase CheR
MISKIIIDDIQDIIKNKTGIVLSNDRLMDLEIVLQSRFIKTNLAPDAYLYYLNNNYNELILLASNFTIQETSFYRNKAHFDRLKYQIFPDLINERMENNKEILVLSAGCATGEEPYTIAMILYDLVPRIEEWNIRIIGSDINAEVLNYAKEGVYTKYKLRNIDQWYIDRFFTQIEKQSETVYQLKPEIKNMIEFRQCNLIREPFELVDLHNVDIILCENVIIYFNHESTQRLISNFYNILRDRGFIFLGYSETLNLIEHNYTLSWWQDSFAYQKEEKLVIKKRSKFLSPTFLKKKQVLQEDLQDLCKKSYEEIIYLLIKNCDERNIDNSIVLLEFLETSSIKTDEGFYIIKAEYLLDKNKYIDAANACSKSISINPYFIDAHIMLGYIYLEADMLENAEFELKTSLYIDKTSILACYYYALYNKKAGNEIQYEQYMNEAKTLFIENKCKFKTKLFPIKREMQLSIADTIIKK